MKKILSLLALLLTICSGAWADGVTLTAFSGTRNFTSDTSTNWSALTKNGTIYSPSEASPTLMFTSVGNDLAFNSTNGLQFGSSSAGCALVFYISAPSNISVDVVRRDKDTEFKLDYMGTSPLEAVTSSNYKTAGTNKSSVTLSSTNTTGTLSATGAAAGYYKVYADLRAYIKTLSVTASTTYTVTYKANGGTGEDIEDDKAASVAENTFTAPDGKAFSGWNTAADGSGTAYAVGAAVASNLTLYAQWSTAYSVTYNGNGAGSGSAPTDAKAYAEGNTVTVLGNTGSLVKSGYTFIGWNTADDGTGTDYAAGATFDMGAADVTLYAVWAKNDYSWSQKTTSGTVAVDSEVETSTGGKMVVTTATIKYAGTGIEFSSSAEVTVTLNKKMQAGTVITGVLYYGSTKEDRTLYLQNSTKTTKATWRLDAVESTKTSETFTYTVVAGDGLAGSDVFVLKRKNNVYLTSLTVANCAPASQDITVGATGFATIGLPFATTVPEGVTAYAVESVTDSKVKMSSAIAAGTTIPANKGYVIVASPEETYTFTEVAEAEYEGTNLLQAVGATPKAATTDAPIYVFAITDATNKKVGFKKATSGSLGAYKAYLPGSVSTQNSLPLSFEDEATAINGVAEEASDAAPIKVVTAKGIQIGKFNVAGQQVK